MKAMVRVPKLDGKYLTTMHTMVYTYNEDDVLTKTAEMFRQVDCSSMERWFETAGDPWKPQG